MDTPGKKHDIFICSAKEDNGIALAMCKFLEAQGLACWIASRDIQAGKDYARSIIDAIQSSSVLVVVLSEQANLSNHVRIEVERAFTHNINILPFRVQDVQPQQSLEYFLSSYHWLDAIDGKPADHFDALSRNCAALLGRELKPTRQKSKPGPGLEKPADRAVEPTPEDTVQPKPAEPPASNPKKEAPVEPLPPAPPVVPHQRIIKKDEYPLPIKPPVPPIGKKSFNKTWLWLALCFAGLIALFFLYKSVFQKHTITFKNNTLTAIFIELDGDMKTIPSGGTFDYTAKNKYHLQTQASTYILNSKGGILGQKIIWHIDTVVSSWKNFSYPLYIGPNFFLLRVVNNSPANINYMKMTASEFNYTFDYNIYIPNDGRSYDMGYFRTLSDLNVYIRDANNKYLTWDNGKNLTYPNLYNQYVSFPYKY